MSFRLPQSLNGGPRPETGANVLDYEIAQQKAETLGDMGRKVEQALHRLREFDARQDDARQDDARQDDRRDNAAHEAGATRSRLVDEAARRVWALMVQRELCGLRHWDAVVRSYGVPREV